MAIESLNRAVRVDPRDERGWWQLAAAYELTGRYAEAGAALERTLDLGRHGSPAVAARLARLRALVATSPPAGSVAGVAAAP